MHHFFVEPSQIQGNHIFIDGPDVNHIRNVLRMNPGEEVNVTDGSGEKVYRCAIASIGEDKVELDRKSTRLNSSHWKQSRMPSSA